MSSDNESCDTKSSIQDLKLHTLLDGKLKILCHACLASDRKLFPLGRHADLYRNIGDVSESIDQNEIFLCWECTAMLRKMKLFKEKLNEAQIILKHYYETWDSSLPQCLSQLKIECNDTETSGLWSKISMDDSKEMPETIKLESESLCYDESNEYYDKENVQEESVDHEDYSNIESFEDIKQSPKSNDEENLLKETVDHEDFPNIVYLEDIKQLPKSNDNKIKTSKHKCKKRVHEQLFKRRYKKLTLSTLEKEFVTKQAIGCTEVNNWIKSEKNSSYFKGLLKKCDKCVMKITLPLSAHNNLYHSKSIGSHCCQFCQSYFTCDNKLSDHLKQHYTIYCCQICGYRCYSNGHMQSHFTEHKKTFQCKECGACFNHIRKFQSHYRDLHTVFICDHCNKQCRTKNAIKKHMRHHEVPKCDICNITFKKLRILKGHMRLKHNNSGGENAFCVRCDKQFNNVQLYKRHLQGSVAHADERNAKKSIDKVSCPECNNVYSRKIYMMNHYRHVHMKKTKYYCAECDKFFLNRTRLLEHRKYNHEGRVKEKDKLCSICGRGFAEKRTLVNHIRTHSGERPFECMYCEAKFTQKQAMLSHVKFIHLKNKRKKI